MKTTLRSIVALSVGMIFIISALACCCLGKLVHAKGFVKTASHACCNSGKADSSSKRTGSDGCPHAQASVAMTVGGIDVSFDLAKDIHFSNMVGSLQAYVQPVFLQLAYGAAPPGRGSSVPLYLQYRVIRI
ncbi:MAG: hypothetical protein HQL17_06040 [Candidatus Omnitrophica bacterium]|nr:hypothetical protein [Candidatus Omnitrophota bacterium]